MKCSTAIPAEWQGPGLSFQKLGGITCIHCLSTPAPCRTPDSACSGPRNRSSAQGGRPPPHPGTGIQGWSFLDLHPSKTNIWLPLVASFTHPLVHSTALSQTSTGLHAPCYLWGTQWLRRPTSWPRSCRRDRQRDRVIVAKTGSWGWGWDTRGDFQEQSMWRASLFQR